jgi:hypothetical protein
MPCGPEQKRGLESVLGIVRTVENTLADAHDRWAVTADDGRKCRIISLPDIVPQQVAVGHSRSVLTSQGTTEAIDNRAQLHCRHVLHP